MSVEDITIERAPHLATRKVVERDGHDAPKVLYEVYDAFNRDYFDNRLGAPLLFVMATNGPRAMGDYCGRDIHGLRSRIRIRPSILTRGERWVFDVLLHEMVHAWCQEVEGAPEDGYRGHGPIFAAKCNEIGEKLDLPPVAARPRGKKKSELLDCAQWPHCVRPDGYYGPEDPRKKRLPSPKSKPVQPDLSSVYETARRFLTNPRALYLSALAVAVSDVQPEDPVEFSFDSKNAAILAFSVIAMMNRKTLGILAASLAGFNDTGIYEDKKPDEEFAKKIFKTLEIARNTRDAIRGVSK